MSEGREQVAAPPDRPLWREIFRGFQIALDPRKLLVAAAGIVATSIVWWLLSVIFYYPAPDRNADEYSNAAIQRQLGDRKKPGTNESYTEQDLKQIGDERHAADVARWRVLDELAGPSGRLRVMPWNEFRGENPLTFINRLFATPPATWGEQIGRYLQSAAPVLLEPFVKLFLPVSRLLSAGVSPLTRLYLLLGLLASLAIWAFCAGVITRIAAVQYARKGPISIRQAILFVLRRYVSYLSAPLLPLGIITGGVVLLMIVGFLGLIPLLGDIVVFGVGLPIILLVGAGMGFFVVGLISLPLMFVTLSAEGDQSDALDAVSRSMNYLYQAPWRFIAYWALALVYGVAVTFFVIVFVTLAVYLGKWGVSQTAAALVSSREPSFLFIYAPETLGWRQLLTADSPYAVALTPEPEPQSGNIRYVSRPVNEALYAQARADLTFYNRLGAGLVGLWLGLLALMLVGFSYSFFWSVATIIYMLLRKVLDEVELQEIYEEEEEGSGDGWLKLADGTTADSTASATAASAAVSSGGTTAAPAPTPEPKPASSAVPTALGLITPGTTSPPESYPPATPAPPAAGTSPAAGTPLLSGTPPATTPPLPTDVMNIPPRTPTPSAMETTTPPAPSPPSVATSTPGGESRLTDVSTASAPAAAAAAPSPLPATGEETTPAMPPPAPQPTVTPPSDTQSPQATAPGAEPPPAVPPETPRLTGEGDSSSGSPPAAAESPKPE